MHARNRLLILLAFVALVAASCSGGGGSNVVLPSPDEMAQEYRSPLLNSNLTPDDWAGHDLMVYCTLIFNTVEGTVEMVENHSAMAHFNVRPMLQDPFVCPNLNCITIQIIDIDPVNDIYTAEAILRNPTNLVGYDVRGIMYLNPAKETALLNPDDYIILYDPLEQINPFRAFGKEYTQRQFPPAAVYNEIYQVYIPPPPPLFNIGYAIDASWPKNCREPYEITDITYSGNLTPSGGSGTISCRVRDHQEDVESVQVDLYDMTGGVEDMVYDPVQETWSVTFSNDLGKPVGEYEYLIAAKSEGYNLKLYNYVTVEVVPDTAQEYITGRVYDCYTMEPLDGAQVSIVNQDISGYQPPSTNVFAGEYTVLVEPGVYDMSISTVGYDLMVCNGVIVPPGEIYQIDFGLNIVGDPDTMVGNPYHYYSGGAVGKVTDATTGDPIAEAAVRVRSDDLGQDLEPLPKFSGAAACKPTGYYSVTEAIAYYLDYSTDQYKQASQWTIYCSAPGYEAIEIDTVAIVPNVVMPNVHFALNPIEPGKEIIFHEDFEVSTGWTYESYPTPYNINMWHIQKWNPSIINMCITNGWSWAAPDEDDGGIIPEPPTSPYDPGPNESYMWYGWESQGCFLGPHDPGDQTSPGGGTSLEEHGGYAISPAIDLSGYPNGLLAFESLWDIESMNPPTFDLCEVFIRDDMGMYQALDFLNPAMDPFQERDPISSGGNNRDGVWHHLVYDISAYMGNTNSRVAFRFHTSDELYNGFKGWFIDNIYIYGY
jgi:hypothetical protein